MSHIGTLKIDHGTFDLLVEYEYTPGSPGINTLSNGDPGYPDEPEELQITSCILATKAKMTIPSVTIDLAAINFLDTFDLLDGIAELCLDQIAEENEAAREDYEADKAFYASEDGQQTL